MPQEPPRSRASSSFALPQDGFSALSFPRYSRFFLSDYLPARGSGPPRAVFDLIEPDFRSKTLCLPRSLGAEGPCSSIARNARICVFPFDFVVLYPMLPKATCLTCCNARHAVRISIQRHARARSAGRFPRHSLALGAGQRLDHHSAPPRIQPESSPKATGTVQLTDTDKQAPDAMHMTGISHTREPLFEKTGRITRARQPRCHRWVDLSIEEDPRGLGATWQTIMTAIEDRSSRKRSYVPAVRRQDENRFENPAGR